MLLRYFLPLFLMTAAVAILSNGCGTEKAKSPVAEGGEYFKAYCTMCHGDNAKGEGHMAAMLNTPPSDLTKIAQRRSGNFPDAEIASIIYNIENVPGHSIGDMPVWSETFKKSEGITDEAVLKEKIDHIVAYLKTIQQ